MPPSIRPATDRDIPTIVAVHDAAYPPDVSRLHPSWLQHLSRSVPERFRPLRMVAEEDHRVIGFGQARVLLDFDHPGKLRFNLVVRPSQQRRGIGTALLDRLLDTLRPRNPVLIRTICREDLLPAVRFLHKHGFVEEERTLESSLPLSTFDPDRFGEALDRVFARGIRIHRLTDLGGMEGWGSDFHELMVSLETDMPNADRYIPPTLADMSRVWFQSPMFWPEATFVARDGNRLIGASNLERDLADERQVQTEVTGVRGEYRRGGIATALKVTGLTYAKALGFQTIRVRNDATNRAMLTLNRKLGFVPHPAWIGMVRHLRSDDPCPGRSTAP